MGLQVDISKQQCVLLCEMDGIGAYLGSDVKLLSTVS